MDQIEALADGIMQFEGWHRDSRSWRNRNPGNLRPLHTTDQQDGDNYRVFNSLAEGFVALTTDLKAKFEGSHGLTAQALGREPTLLDLLNVYAPAGDANNPTAYTQFVCGWVAHATGRPVQPTTTFTDFLGGLKL